MRRYKAVDTSQTVLSKIGLYFLAGEVGKLQSEFAKRGVKLLALSCNDVDSHKG